MLAVAIGTAHGMYKGTPFIDVDRVKAIHAKVAVPLVMHGGSFTPDESIRAAIRAGIAKVNIDTDMRVAFFDAVKGYMEKMEAEHGEADQRGEPRKYDIRKILGAARDAMRERVADRIRLFGCSGKADKACP
jgi:fructose-bisphosphate aldolase class II